MCKLKRSVAAGFGIFALILTLGTAIHSHAFSYVTATKTARMAAICTQVDSGGAAGRIEFGTNNAGSFGTTLAVFTLNYSPACTVSGSTLTFAGFPKQDTSADANGTAAWARVCTSAGCASGTVISGLTVCSSGCDVNLDNPSISIGQLVTFSSMTLTHAP